MRAGVAVDRTGPGTCWGSPVLGFAVVRPSWVRGDQILRLNRCLHTGGCLAPASGHLHVLGVAASSADELEPRPPSLGALTEQSACPHPLLDGFPS